MIEKRRNLVFRFLPGLFLSGLLLLSGCSQDDVSGVPVGSRAIGFRAQGGMSSLKATTTGADYIRSFAVNAHYGTYDDQGKFLIEGVTVYRGEGGGTDWTYSPQAYFPTEDKGDVNFFAYSPSGSKYVEGSLKDAAVANDADQKITYVVPEPDGSATSQEDLLVARQTVEYSTVNSAYPGAAVSLQFHHALSRILVAASSSLGQEVPVVITGLELKNLYTKGTLPLNSDDLLATAWGHITGQAGAKVLWTNDGSTTANYAYSLPASGVHVGEVAATVTGDDQGIFILPQQTKGTDVTDTDRDGEFGLEIAYTVNGNPAPAPAFIQFPDLVNSTDESVTFEIGRQYVLNLTFGAGSGTGGGGDTPGGSDPDINIGAKISFGTLGVDGYPEDDIDVYPPQPTPEMYAHDPVIWSQSNIYYDEAADATDGVGAMTFSEETAYKYQGVYFRWGSLVGVSVGANYSNFSVDDYLFIPDVASGLYHKVKIEDLATHSETSDVIGLFKTSLSLAPAVWTNVGAGDSDALTALWLALPYATNTDVTPVSPVSVTGRTFRDDNALTTATGTTLAYSSYKGDICKYLVDKKSTNGNSASITDGYAWRLPTSNEFSLGSGGTNTNTDDTDFIIGDYTTRWKSDNSNGGIVTAGSNPENGTALMSVGGYSFYTLTWVSDGSANPDFPASGYRILDPGNQNGIGFGGGYWSSSANGASGAYGLGFSSGNVNPYGGSVRTDGFSVRCVRL